MPHPTDNMNFIGDFRSKINEVPNQKVSEADANASKELGRLAIYLRDNFPKEAATKEKTVDVVIDLLNEFKAQKDAMKGMFGNFTDKLPG